MEISTDFTTEFHSNSGKQNIPEFREWKEQNQDMPAELQQIAADISTNCGQDACSTSCTNKIREYVTLAAAVMWKWRDDNLKGSVKSNQNPSGWLTEKLPEEAQKDLEKLRVNFMPLWTRNKT